MNPIQTPADFLKFLWDDRASAVNLRDTMAKDLSEKRIDNMRERKAFLQNLVIASVTLLGLISAFSVIGENSRITHPYFITGVAMHLLLICFTAVYLREFIDQDSEGLLKMQDKYTNIIEVKVKFIDEYIHDFVQNGGNFQDKLRDYLSKTPELPTMKSLAKDAEQVDKERELRLKNEHELEFNGEIIVFLFVCGTALIFLSLVGYYPTFIHLGLGLFFVFALIFTDSLSKLSRPLFKFLKFITRKEFFKRNENK